MKKTEFEITVKLKYKVYQDLKGNWIADVTRKCREEDLIAFKVVRLAECIKYVSQVIMEKTSQMIKVPEKYHVILNGLEEELINAKMIMNVIFSKETEKSIV